ncbi:MAG TPA: hypothetical protein PL195_07115, partial [bacterium]|nr:hypothetical protein [bacterium]
MKHLIYVFLLVFTVISCDSSGIHRIKVTDDAGETNDELIDDTDAGNSGDTGNTGNSGNSGDTGDT